MAVQEEYVSDEWAGHRDVQAAHFAKNTDPYSLCEASYG
jgi:hypothetical protein